MSHRTDIALLEGDQDLAPAQVIPKTKRKEWLKIVGAFLSGIVLTVIVVVIVRAVTKSDASSGEPTPPPPPPPPGDSWNPADYIDNAAFYEQIPLHPLNQTDNVRLDRFSAPVVSPNGRWVVFSRTQYRMPNSNSSATTLWLAPTPVQVSLAEMANGAFALTRPLWGSADTNPCWSADSTTILFLSNRGTSGLSQIYQIAVPASNPGGYTSFTQLTDFPVDLDNLLYTAGSGIAAFSAQVYPGMTMAETAATQTAIAASGRTGTLYSKLFVRHWSQFSDHTRNHPFVLQLQQSSGVFSVPAGAAPVDVLGLVDSDSPTRPFGGREEFSFSKSGLRFAFTRRFDENSSVAWTTDLNIFYVDITKSGAAPLLTVTPPTCITCANLATDTGPVFSPFDENIMMYRAMTVPVYESGKLGLRIWDGQQIQWVADDWDLSLSSIDWSIPANGSSALATVEERGRMRVYAIDLTTGARNGPVPYNYSITAVASIPGSSYLVCTATSLMFPPSIATLDTTTGATTAMTGLNAGVIAKVAFGSYEEFNFVGAHGQSVMGWVMRPTNYVAGQKYPVAFLIHGGPQGAWEDMWSFRWHPEVYAGAGFAVVSINFHGSTGYGQNFTDSIREDYGGAPYYDLMTGLDYAISTYSFLDGTRVAALGASYGGYMIFWIAGHTSRFRTLVAHSGILDTYSFYYMTEELWFPEHDMPNVPWVNTTAYQRWNPVNYVQYWNTSMLVIHGGRDHRIAESQGLGAFTALQRQGIESEFLYYPNENHWILNPLNSVQWHEVVLNWITRHTAA